MPESSSNSRHFSWLVKSCFPNPQDTTPPISISKPINLTSSTPKSTISTLPDDLLLECLSRVPSSSLPYLSLVCRRWSHLLLSPHFLSLRRLRHLLLPTIFTLSSSDSALLISSLPNLHGPWKLGPFVPFHVGFHLNVSHARLCAIGPRIFVIGRQDMFCYDTWSGSFNYKSPMISPTKRFAAAVVSARIYVTGGAEVEEYDPERDAWRVVSHAPRRRYGCLGVAVDGVFYVIGGLKIGGACGSEDARAAAMAGAEASVYASSMDLYDVEGGLWMRSRAVPGGGCVVAACAAGGYIYILASHAVELSFWRFDARRKGGSGGGGGGFGEWCRIKCPPLPAQVRLDGTVRFSCVGLEDKVVLIQVIGCIDDLLRRSGRNAKGFKEGLVLIYDSVDGEWSRGPDLPEAIQRAACVSVEC